MDPAMQFAWRVAALPLVVALASSAAGAQSIDDATKAAARDLGYAGVEAYQAGRYPTASEKFEKAYRLVRTPALGLWSARALAKQGFYVEAAERYQEVTLLETSGSGVAVQRQAQADAAAELAQLEPRIPRVVITVPGARNDVRVTIDGAPLAFELIGEPRPLNPGRHQIVASRGDERVTTEISIAEGEKKPVVLRFERYPASGIPPRSEPGASDANRAADMPSPRADATAEPDPGATRRTVAWAALGTGAAALLVGGVTELMAQNRLGDIHRACGGNTCPSSQRDLVNQYDSLRSITIYALAGGTLIAGAGAALLLTSPKPSAAAVQLVLSPACSGFAGRF